MTLARVELIYVIWLPIRSCCCIFGLYFRYEYSDSEFQEFINLIEKVLQRGGVKNPLNFFPVLQKLPEDKKVIATVSHYSRTLF